jgi:creatinine amidohydrolase/Fe(II)-dependent formamide hydrolase-like protein
MRYEMMLPHQIRNAIDMRWPVVLPLGVLEYHGEHMAVGMDTLVVVKLLELLEAEAQLVILPAFYYGASSYAVEPPEGNGSVQVNADKLFPFAQDLFRALLRIGFRNIHFFIHHQTENFTVGMPTDLAFKFAARQAIFEFLEIERGEGWWGSENMADYYTQQASGDDPFNWIKGHPLMTPEIIRNYPFDHAGQGETSLLMALCPEGVDMRRFSREKWYSRSAAEASPEVGGKAREMILTHMRLALGFTSKSI